MIEPEPLQQLEGTYVQCSHRKLSYFSGCDYFRLSSHSKVHLALRRALKRCGLNVAASRMTTGNHPLYSALEKALADFFKAESALLVSTGYATNMIVAQACSGQFSHALMDQLAHPSLQDAANLLDCPILKFPHRSVTHVAAAIDRCGPGAKIILLTDGMFARDGSVAPLREYQRALPDDAVMLVDDAHGAGLLGANGRGALEETGAPVRGVIQTLTLSKAFGAYGGVILGPKSFRNRILERSRQFIGSTPLPLPLVAAARQGLELLVSTGMSLRTRIRRNTAYVRKELDRAGLALPETPGPIIALQPGNHTTTLKIKRALLKAGIYPPLVKYPGAPAAGYFRFVISSQHSPAQLDNLVRTLAPLAGLVAPLADN